MDILSEKFQGKVIRIELGNGYPDLKIGTEVLLFAAQEQAISTNYVKQTM